jgi:glyoxylase-like metal-dependent hydrolase (beta-lactamase superfamily II)
VQIASPDDEPVVEYPAGVHLVRAANAGPLTLDGTNTWLLAGRAADRTVVIDPGPALPDHLAAIRSMGRPAAIILTHHHADHAQSAPALGAEFGIPVYAADDALAIDAQPLRDGDVIERAGWRLGVLATPGHTSDSVCLTIDGAIFTGDTLLGGSTTIIAPPSGSLASYFSTMTRLSALAGMAGLPGHGPAISSAGDWARRNAHHRERRLAQLADVYDRVVRDGAESRDRLRLVAEAAYGEGGAPVADFVEVMVAAQLSYLAERGDIAGWSPR